MSENDTTLESDVKPEDEIEKEILPNEEPVAESNEEGENKYPTYLEDDKTALIEKEVRRASQQYYENLEDSAEIHEESPPLEERVHSKEKSRDKQIRFEEIEEKTNDEQEPIDKNDDNQDLQKIEEPIAKEEKEVSVAKETFSRKSGGNEDFSLQPEQPTLRERKASKDMEKHIRIRKIERKLSSEFSNDSYENKKKETPTTNISSNRRSKDLTSSDIVPRQRKIESNYEPPRDYSTTPKSRDTIKRDRSFKSPVKVPNYSTREKKAENYFSMDNYYPGKFSSTPRTDTKKINTSQKCIDEFNTNYGASSKSAGSESRSSTPTTDFIKTLSDKTGHSPITRSLYETNLDNFNSSFTDFNYKPVSSYLSSTNYSYPKARNLYDPYYYYNDYRYYPYHRTYNNYSTPYYSSSYYTPTSSYVRTYTNDNDSYFYPRGGLYSPRLYDDVYSVKDVYNVADRITSNAESTLNTFTSNSVYPYFNEYLDSNYNFYPNVGYKSINYSYPSYLSAY
ncbi:unnamed protein product [Gordionus sp. m RMFG-2023]